jgi:hypothetical protein
MGHAGMLYIEARIPEQRVRNLRAAMHSSSDGFESEPSQPEGSLPPGGTSSSSPAGYIIFIYSLDSATLCDILLCSNTPEEHTVAIFKLWLNLTLASLTLQP